MGKPKLDRVPKVKIPTKYQIFINNEISKLKLFYPKLKLQEIRKKAAEKWKQLKKQKKCKRSPKTRSPGSKTVSFCDEVSVKSPTPDTSFEPVEEPRKRTPFLNKVKTVTSPVGIMKKSPNGNASGKKKKKNVPKSKDEGAKLRRSIIYFSPKKDNQEIVPVSNFPKFQNKNCSWSYKNEVSAKKLNQDLDLDTLKKKQKPVANKKEKASQFFYSKRKEKSLDKGNSSCNFKNHEDEEETMIEEVSPVSSSTIPKTPAKRGQYQNVVVISPFSKKARNNIGDLSQKSKEETFNVLKSNSTSSKDCEESERKVSRTLVIEERYNKGLTRNKFKGVESFSPSSSESDCESAHEVSAYLKLKTKEISPILKRVEDAQSGQSSPVSNLSDWTRDTRIIDRGPEMSKSIYLSSQSMSEDPFPDDFDRSPDDFTKPGSGNFEKNLKKSLSEEPFPDDFDRSPVMKKITKTRNKNLSQQTASQKSISNDIQTSRRQDDRTKTNEKNKNQLKIFNVCSGSGSAESKKEIQMDSIEETMEELEIISGKVSQNSNSSQSSLSGSLVYDCVPPTPRIEKKNSGPPSISLSAETLPFSRNRFISEDNKSSLNKIQDSEVKARAVYDYKSPPSDRENAQSSKASTIYDDSPSQSDDENSQDYEVISVKASTVYDDDGSTFLSLKDDTAQDRFYDNEDPLLPIKDSKRNDVSESSNSISKFKEVKNRKKTFFNPSSKFDSPLNCGNDLSLDFDRVVNPEDSEAKEESDATIKRKTCQVVFDLEAELAKRAKIVESMYEHGIINKFDDLALEDSEQFENSNKTRSDFSFPSQRDKRNEANATSSDISMRGSSDQNQSMEKETLMEKSDKNDYFEIDLDNFDISYEARRHGIDLSTLSPINKKDLENIPDHLKKMKGWKLIVEKYF